MYVQTFALLVPDQLAIQIRLNRSALVVTSNIKFEVKRKLMEASFLLFNKDRVISQRVKSLVFTWTIDGT